MSKILVLWSSCNREAILKAAAEFNEVILSRNKKINETKRYTQYKINSIHNRKPWSLI